MRVRLLVVVLSLLAFSVGIAQASPVRHTAVSRAPIRYIAVSEQPTAIQPAGKAEADLAYQAGFNTLRIIMPWTYPHQADVVNDVPRICSVAAEASVYHMTIFLDVVPANATPPVTATQINQYDKTIGDYLQNLIGPNGCAKGLAELDVQVDNEPNYQVFRPQATAPEDYTHLLIRTFWFVHKQSAMHGFSVPVKVIGGELASSHDPVAFMNRMHDEAQRMHIHGAFFDMFSYHCYGTDSSQLPTPPDAVQQAILADFGQSVPLLCSEFAVSTATPSAHLSISVVNQSEALQSQLFCQAEFMAVNKNLAGFGWFRLFDDPSGQATGLYYYDPALGMQGDHPVAKTSLPAIRQDNAAALNGSLNCG